MFGVSPRYEDLQWTGLEFPRAKFERITSINLDDWRKEIESHAELFAKLAGRLPRALEETKSKFAHRLRRISTSAALFPSRSTGIFARCNPHAF